MQRALEAYAERGDRAIGALLAEDFDGLETLMRGRNAAYHNFLAAESCYRQLGHEVQKEPGSKEMLERINRVNRQLSDGIEKARADLQGSLTRTIVARKKLAHFRASTELDNRFQGSV